MTKQDSFNQEIEIEHYTGLKLFSIWCGLVLLALSFWAVILLCLFSLKDFIEYLINGEASASGCGFFNKSSGLSGFAKKTKGGLGIIFVKKEKTNV